MKKSGFTIGFLVIILVAIFGVSNVFSYSYESSQEKSGQFDGKIVVANRNSGTISIIDTATDTVDQTVALPGDSPEPMYVVYTFAGNRVFVGDRANGQVAVFDADYFTLDGTVPTGAGVFHMWANPQNTQLWVNNDVDNTATVIQPRAMEVIATVPMPEDLIQQGGKPHDVVLDSHYAYITIVGLPGEDYVVKYSQKTFKEVDRAKVGIDSHVSLTLRNNMLYVPTQNSDRVFILNRKTFELVQELDIPGAHGAGMAFDGKNFYVTNISGGGIAGLFTIDTKTNTVIGDAVDTPFPVPHNIALTPKSRKLYVTHSGGASNKVTVFTMTPGDPVPSFEGEVTVGFNPFGLSFVP